MSKKKVSSKNELLWKLRKISEQVWFYWIMQLFYIGCNYPLLLQSFHFNKTLIHFYSGQILTHVRIKTRILRHQNLPKALARKIIWAILWRATFRTFPRPFPSPEGIDCPMSVHPLEISSPNWSRQAQQITLVISATPMESDTLSGHFTFQT